MKVHILQPPDSEALSILQEKLDPGIELTFGDQIPDPADYHALVGGRPPREFVAASANLKTLIIPWAGLPSTFFVKIKSKMSALKSMTTVCSSKEYSTTSELWRTEQL